MSHTIVEPEQKEAGEPTSAAPAVAARSDHAPDQTLSTIEPKSGWRALDLKELWRFRELLFFLTWRDVKVRYKQTFLGAAWAILQPVMMMVVFTIFLGKLAKMPSGDIPYPIFVYAGLLPWTFFSHAISTAGNSVVVAHNMVTKVYLPRLAIPFSAVGAALVDLAIAFLVLVAMMVYYGIPVGWGVLVLPIVVFLITLTALGIGTFLAALNVNYRDFKYTIPYLVQIWMFATPTVYMSLDEARERTARAETATATTDAETATTEITSRDSAPTGDEDGDENAKSGRLSGRMKYVVYANPLTGLVGTFRAATLGGPIPWSTLGYSGAIAVAMFFGGVLFFRRVEDSFADTI